MSIAAALMTGVAVACCVFALLSRVRPNELSGPARQWIELFRSEIRSGALDAPATSDRRLWATATAAGAVVGWSVGGLLVAVAFGVASPFLLRQLLLQRHAARARAVDRCAGDLAAALASALAAGQSVRGALLEIDSIPEPLVTELRQTSALLAMGESTGDALAALCSQTGSGRIESMVGAIELHQGSGGDLVGLLRELSAAFRERERALDDAHSASAQARFTAIVVAAIPLVLAVVVELAKPGSVTGALTFVPSAVMLAIAFGLMLTGALLCRRIASAR